MQVIARIQSPLTQKFGVPRQGNMARHIKSSIVFEPHYRQRESLRGLNGYSHLWLIWCFHLNEAQKGANWQPTVRPPRLGGNERVGVFASRSPFRPNGLGLSVVKIEAIHPDDPHGAFLTISGADLVDGTPIYDIKPYIPYADSIPDAKGGFAAPGDQHRLHVKYGAELCLPQGISKDWLLAMHECVSLDPRPAYHHDPERIYHMILQPYEVSFRVAQDCASITSITPLSPAKHE